MHARDGRRNALPTMLAGAALCLAAAGCLRLAPRTLNRSACGAPPATAGARIEPLGQTPHARLGGAAAGPTFSAPRAPAATPSIPYAWRRPNTGPTVGAASSWPKNDWDRDDKKNRGRKKNNKKNDRKKNSRKKGK